MEDVELELTIWDEIRQLLTDRWGEIMVDFLEIVIQLVIFTLIFMVIHYLINKILSENLAQKLRIRKNKTDKQRISTISNLIRNAANYIMYFFFGYIILNVFGFPIGTLLASAGIAGVALGFGAQVFVTDVINGFFIIFENHFEVGDFVELPQHEISGTIFLVGIRSTVIKSASGHLYYIPNSEIKLVNNQSRKNISVLVDLPIDDESQIHEIMRIVESVTERLKIEYEEDLADTPTINGIVRGENQTFNYRVTFIVKNGEQYRLTSVFYQAFLVAFQENNIKFPTSSFGA